MGTMTYKAWKDKRQAECNALPLFFAFSNDQFAKCLSERGLSMDNEDDLKKIVRITNGGFCLKTDLPKVKEFFDSDDLRKRMNNKAFAKSAFLYEMRNHEYGINWQADWDVCSVFGNCEYDDGKDYTDYLKEMGYEDKHIIAYAEARTTYYRTCSE